MELWLKTTLILCTFGFLKELRPTEPFVTNYIIDFKNITAEEIIHVAFPVSTYSSLISLAVVLLVTDLLLYKPIVVLEGICHFLTWGILTLTSGLAWLIGVEIIYGIASSAETAYSTYIYAQVDPEHYQKVTSHTHGARLTGKFLGGLIAQLLITFGLLNYHQLNYITVTCVAVGFLCTLFLPSVNANIEYVVKRTKEDGYEKGKGREQEVESPLEAKENETADCQEEKPTGNGLKDFFGVLIQELKTAFGNGYVLKWSLWWAIASAGQSQVINYIQALWEKVREEGGNDEQLYNGAVKALHTFLSAALTFSIGYVNFSWNKWSEVTLTLISIVQGLMLVWMARTSSLYMAYFSYIVFRTIHPVMLTVASSEIAQQIKNNSHYSYGLIFGINNFIALSLQTLLTLIVADMKGLALDERTQYVVYGVCFIILGAVIGTTFVTTFCRGLSRSRSKAGEASSFSQTSTSAASNNHVQFSKIPQAEQENGDSDAVNGKTDLV